MSARANTADLAELATRFQAHANQWKAATAFSSSTSVMIAHPVYQAIIALGPSVMPFVLRDLERESAHWFEALQAITGEDPVAPEDWGRIPAMRAAWLTWGRQQALTKL